MAKRKKGISPIIATVLLVLFTVILAVLITIWGSDFAKKTTQMAEEDVNLQLECVDKVDVTILDVCWKDSDTVVVSLQNNREKEISSFKARLYKDMTDIKSDITLPFLGSFASYNEDIKWTGSAKDVKMVEMIPLIKIGEKVGSCPANKEKFGETSADSIKKC